MTIPLLCALVVTVATFVAYGWAYRKVAHEDDAFLFKIILRSFALNIILATWLIWSFVR